MSGSDHDIDRGDHDSRVEGREAFGSAPKFLAGGGEMGRRIREFNWAENPLGPPESWPQSLKTAVRILLTSRQPLWIGWGPELTYLYNDPYLGIIGGKHPWALGRPTAAVWREIYDVISPMLSTALSGDQGTYVESQLLLMERHGYREETYYTFSYSPIPTDDGGVGGILCANTDNTRQVIGERRLALLRELAARCMAARARAEVYRRSVDVLAADGRGVVFAALYTWSGEQSGPVLAGSAGIEADHPLLEKLVRIEGERPAAAEMRVIETAGWTLERPLPTGAWTEPPSRCAWVPISLGTGTSPRVVLIVGLNPYRLVDIDYRNFLTLVAGQISSGLTSAQAYEEERRRAEALAELDRAKMQFFSNVSHELRTPLTLMLGPVEDLLRTEGSGVGVEARRDLQVVHRNALRLLKLVNALLDFSRIEAGRMQVLLEPTDLGRFTAETVQEFRTAIERAGLRFIVSIQPWTEPVLVDREMWEKVVLNLLSNAFKYTLEGEIELSLAKEADWICLKVRDTGVGIPQEELPRIFDRFHRVKGTLGRTHEGTGIGLALVQELVRLHGGRVSASSAVDEGSVFTVEIPADIERTEGRRTTRELLERPAKKRVDAHVAEALRWMPIRSRAEIEAAVVDRKPAPSAEERDRARVLWADDNADMREYVARLLSTQYHVVTVVDGQEALECARRERPDVILSDIMMPRLDGFGLLRAIRADETLRTVPVILLSARAGEEARVEGVDAGADDYLVKPFSARELLARVEAHVGMVRYRREAMKALQLREEQLEKINRELELRLGQLQQINEELRQSRLDALELMREAVDTRGQLETLNTKLRAEIRERESAHWALRQRTAQFETLLNQAPVGVVLVDADFRIRDVNPAGRALFPQIEQPVGQELGEVVRQLRGEPQASEIICGFRHTLESGEPLISPTPSMRTTDREQRDFYEWRIDRIPLPDGRFGVVGYFRDVSAQVRARMTVAYSEERYRSMVSVLTDVPWVADADGGFSEPQTAWEAYTGQAWEEHRGFGWVRALHPDDRERLLGEWKRAIARREPMESRGRFWRAASEEWRHYIVKAAPLFNPDGSVREWVGTCTDNENQIRAEEQLKLARDEALAANRAKDEFLATLSHELRTPLNPVLLVASDHARSPDLSEAVRNDFKMIADNVSLQARLIDDLLDLNRIIRGKMALEMRELDVHQVLRDASLAVREEAAAKQLKMRFALQAKRRCVSGDSVRLRQVFWNVLRNAVKFTDTGGLVEVTTRDDDKTGMIDLRIRDTGIGMGPEELARIFQPFVQGRHAASEHPQSYGGLGLGLAISRMLVEMHGGRIAAESPGPGLGTTISIELRPLPVGPRNDPETSAAPSWQIPGKEMVGAGSPKRVLFVEDHGPTRMALSALLRRRGLEVVAADSLESALATAGEIKFDVLISDLGLPDGDGCDLMEKLRVQQPDLRGIAVSGYGMDGDVARSQEAGFGAHLIKPVSVESLERALTQIFRDSAGADVRRGED